jgi:hypothetical protein
LTAGCALVITAATSSARCVRRPESPRLRSAAAAPQLNPDSLASTAPVSVQLQDLGYPGGADCELGSLRGGIVVRGGASMFRRFAPRGWRPPLEPKRLIGKDDFVGRCASHLQCVGLPSNEPFLVRAAALASACSLTTRWTGRPGQPRWRVRVLGHYLRCQC